MEDRQSVIKKIAGVLQSSPRPIPLSVLPKDYYTLTGKHIPFRELGFGDITSLLKSIPETVKIYADRDGDVVCEAVYSEKNEHIRKLVVGQKRPPGQNKKPKNVRQNAFRAPNRIGNTASSAKAESNWNKISWSAPQSSSGSSSSKFIPNIFPSKYEKEESDYDKSNGLPANSSVDRIVKKAEGSIHVKCLNKQVDRVPQPSTTHKQKLAEFIAEHKLGCAEYTSHQLHKRSNQYCGVVKINDRVFSTYPNDSRSREEAENEAAKCALDDLSLEIKRDESTDLKMTSSSAVVRRLHKMLSSHHNGIINTAVRDMYEEMYGEKLHDGWMSYVNSNDTVFKKADVDATRSIIYAVLDDAYQRCRKFSNASSLSTETDSEPKSYSSPPSDSLSDTSGEMDDAIKRRNLSLTPTLNLPEINSWDVYVTCAESTSDIRIRLIGNDYSAKYEAFALEMREYYEDSCKTFATLSKTDIDIGELVAVKEDGCWHRVQIEEIIEDKVSCLFVDCGDNGKYDIKNLLPLDRQFLTLPFQAVKCQLFNLDAVNDFEINERLVEMIVGHVLIADVVDRSNDVISLKLYDAKERKYSINELLYIQRLEKVSVPKLETGITQVYRSHIGANGTVFIQLFSSDVHVLENVIEAAVNTQIIAASEISSDSVYLARTADDFQRVILKSKVENDMVEAYFVDYGRSDRINVCDIFTVNEDYSYIMKVPYQAVACNLRFLPTTVKEWSPEAIQRLEALTPPEQILIVKKTEGITEVELFKRLLPGGELVSINNTLEFDIGFFTEVSCDEELSFELSSCSQIKKKALPNLVLPDLRKPCDIHVTLAANPFNFMFQLWKDGEQFDMLMLGMNKYYKVEGKGSYLRYCDILNLEYYAFCLDEVWYRVQARVSDDLKTSGMVLVKFIDYGDNHVVFIDTLKHLEPQFRELAPQILQGKLAGIRPINKDWHTEDCIRFRELVEEKQFVAILTRIEENEEDGELCFEMKLVNTRGNSDIYIDKLLIEENRAYRI
ncbi:hypothetical protein CHUAL_002583 [Chamberlinius hualienensis]